MGLRLWVGGLGGETTADEVAELPDVRVANPVDHARPLAAPWQQAGKLDVRPW